MVSKPGSKRLGQSIGEQIDHAMLFQITQDRTVRPPLAPGPIIDPQHAGRCPGRNVRASQNSQDGRWAGSHVQVRQEAGSSFSANGEAQLFNGDLQPPGSSGIGVDSWSQPLAEYGPFALWSATHKTANVKLDPDRHSCTGKISNRSQVATLHSMGWLLTHRALCD
jgi:hypothetical protein